MRSWASKRLLGGAALAAALAAVAIPALGQDQSPESLLPPGFGDTPVAPTPAPGQPTPPAAQPGAPAAPGSEALPAGEEQQATDEADAAADAEETAAAPTPLDLP